MSELDSSDSKLSLSGVLGRLLALSDCEDCDLSHLLSSGRETDMCREDCCRDDTGVPLGWTKPVANLSTDNAAMEMATSPSVDDALYTIVL